MTNEQEDDAALIAALDSVREAAQRYFEHYKNQERLGVWLPQPSPNIEELTSPIIDAMRTHLRFKEDTNRFFGAKQLMRHPWYQSRNLLRIAVERDFVSAVAWYHKVHSTERAALRYVAEVYGLKIAETVRLKNGVSLVSLENLPLSGNAKAVQSQFQITPNKLPLNLTAMPIGAVLETPEVHYSSSYEESWRSDELERTIRAFTLVNGASPVVGTSWLEFVDDDLRMAEFGLITTVPLYEGRPPFSTVDVDADAIEWVERYLSLASEVRPQCDVAIERLNLARRRYSSGDKAIEGAICLEALLGSGDNQEITYKLKLRAALLLSTDLNERREISNAVKDFYQLRSKTVHGISVKPKDIQKHDACAARGLDICAQVLRKLVRSNKTFVPEDWELSGGQPH
jgi:Apea-like HEPN